MVNRHAALQRRRLQHQKLPRDTVMDAEIEWATTSLRTILWEADEEAEHSTGDAAVPRQPHETEEFKSASALREFIHVCLTSGLGGYPIRSLLSSNSTSFIGEGIDYVVQAAELVNKSGQTERVVVKKVKPNAAHGDTGGPSHRTSARRIKTVLKEIRIARHKPLQKVRYVIDFLHYGWDDYAPNAATPCLTAEYAEYGNMRDYLLIRARDPPDPRTLLCLDVVKGLYALHACDIVHGDVKLENMLVFKGYDGKPLAKVADFGSAVLMNETEQSFTYLGTPLYNAPEIRALEDQQGGAKVHRDLLQACDVYSLGLLIWETCSDGSRYLKRHLTEKILRGKLVDLRRIAIRRATSNAAHLGGSETLAVVRCLQMSLAPKPRDRAAMSDILEAIRFSGIPNDDGESMYASLIGLQT